MNNSYIVEVRKSTQLRTERLLAKLSEAEAMVANKACVYATGSFGRLEAGTDSDLDLFIVVKTKKEEKRGRPIRVNQLDGVDEIKLKYHIVSAVQEVGIADFDGGGKYLDSHQIGDFTEWLGSQEDDYRNTLTGRLLMLLESRPLLGKQVYDELLKNVIAAYFKDYETNKDNFVPAFLVNDILRMWRTFCVNYEFNRTKGGSDWKIKNLKLKYSRMLTCYSAILYLLAVFAKSNTVSPTAVKAMVGLTPTERLESLLNSVFINAEAGRELLDEKIRRLLELYSDFLAFAHMDRKTRDPDFERDEAEWRQKSYQFGETFAEALSIVGETDKGTSRLYRMILI